MKTVLFEHKTKVSLGLIGVYGGRSVTVYQDGSVVVRTFLFGQEEPVSEETIACVPKMAVLIEKMIVSRKGELEQIPERLNNRTLDGSHDSGEFGRRRYKR